MEVVVQTEYQDIYRIDIGVLLVINKFERDKLYGERCYLHSAKDRPYNKLTQGLRILKEDTSNREYNYDTKEYAIVCTVPSGTVTHYDFPIKLTDKSNWLYKIKTTGDSFSGNKKEILEMIDEIINLINN